MSDVYGALPQAAMSKAAPATVVLPKAVFPKKIRVIVADDSIESRHILIGVLSNSSALTVVAQVPRAEQIVSAVAHFHPDVVVLDSGMKDLDLAATVDKLCGEDAQAPTSVLILTSADAPRRISISQEFRAAIGAGASSYLLKEKGAAGLVEAVHQTAMGWSVVDPDVMRLIVNRTANGYGNPDQVATQQLVLQALTPRELDILALVGRGMSNDDICVYFGSALSTVKNHVGAILRKIGVRNRLQAALIARELGLQAIQGPVRTENDLEPSPL